MLKMIKTTKQMRLDELIKYIYDERITETTFVDDENEVKVMVNWTSSVEIERFDNGICIGKHVTFTVEIEEPITDVTLLEKAVYVHKNKTLIKDFNTSIDEILNSKHECSVSEIYALINGKLQLVWECDE